jgi:hypothetical protein
LRPQNNTEVTMSTENLIRSLNASYDLEAYGRVISDPAEDPRHDEHEDLIPEHLVAPLDSPEDEREARTADEWALSGDRRYI